MPVTHVIDLSHGKRVNYRPVPPPTKRQMINLCKKIVFTNSCWFWKGRARIRGYPALSLGRGNTFYVQRVAFHWLRSPLPNDLVLDHKMCDNPECVNPFHSEPTTIVDNTHRAGAGAPLTICRRSVHPFPEFRRTNSLGQTFCSECRKERARNWARKRFGYSPERYKS